MNINTENHKPLHRPYKCAKCGATIDACAPVLFLTGVPGFACESCFRETRKTPHDDLRRQLRKMDGE